jgi:hypothetical protein
MPSDRSPGFRFKEGKLYVFRESRVIVLEGWPVLRALHKEDGKPWQEFAPISRVVQPYRPRRKAKPSAQLELDLGAAAAPVPENSLAAQRKRAFDQFRFSLPKPVAARAEKYQSRQWAVLRLFHERPETLEFAQQNPALCYALANFRCFPGVAALKAFADAVKLSESRQRDIAGALGFPATDGAARILAKLAPESASVELMEPLREALKDPEVAKSLAHLPKLNAGAVAIAKEPRLRAASTAKLLSEVAQTAKEKYRANIAVLIEDTLRMFFRVHPTRGTPQFQTIARLREVHDEISVEYLRREEPAIRAFRFPKPPVPGTPDIVPICTIEELIEEGRAQNNCVATYAQRVQSRYTYIYRVLRPERATLSIVRGDDGDWEIDELERRGNSGAAERTYDWVQRWLDEHAMSA